MLSKETLERYRRMTAGQRLKLVLQSIDENEPYLLMGRPEVIERRFQLLERENQGRNKNILEGLALNEEGLSEEGHGKTA
jgi:hypothetical protein